MREFCEAMFGLTDEPKCAVKRAYRMLVSNGDGPLPFYENVSTLLWKKLWRTSLPASAKVLFGKKFLNILQVKVCVLDR